MAANGSPQQRQARRAVVQALSQQMVHAINRGKRIDDAYLDAMRDSLELSSSEFDDLLRDMIAHMEQRIAEEKRLERRLRSGRRLAVV
jgi:hypothetical protein